MGMRRPEPQVPLTIQGLGEKLDQLTAGQAAYEDLLRRLADGQVRHAAVLDLHTTRLNELVHGQHVHTELLNVHTELLNVHTGLLKEHTGQLNVHTGLLKEHTGQLNVHTGLLKEHTELLKELVRGQKEQTELLQQLLQSRGDDPAT